MTKLFKQMMAAIAVVMFVSSSLVGASALAQENGGDNPGTSGTGSTAVHHAKHKKTKKKKAKKSSSKKAKKAPKKSKKSHAHKTETAPPAEAPPAAEAPPMDNTAPAAPGGDMGGANGAAAPAPSNP